MAFPNSALLISQISVESMTTRLNISLYIRRVDQEFWRLFVIIWILATVE